MRKGACIIGVAVALGAGLIDASAAAAAARVWFENQHLEHLSVGSQVESMFEFRTAEGAFCRVGNLTGAAETNGAAKSKMSFSTPPPEANRCGTGGAAIRPAAISVSATSKSALTRRSPRRCGPTARRAAPGRRGACARTRAEPACRAPWAALCGSAAGPGSRSSHRARPRSRSPAARGTGHTHRPAWCRSRGRGWSATSGPGAASDRPGRGTHASGSYRPRPSPPATGRSSASRPPAAARKRSKKGAFATPQRAGQAARRPLRGRHSASTC